MPPEGGGPRGQSTLLLLQYVLALAEDPESEGQEERARSQQDAQGFTPRQDLNLEKAAQAFLRRVVVQERAQPGGQGEARQAAGQVRDQLPAEQAEQARGDRPAEPDPERGEEAAGAHAGA